MGLLDLKEKGVNNGQIIVCGEEDVTSEEGEGLPVGGRES